MTLEEKRKKQREHSRKHYQMNRDKINNAIGKKCPCGRDSIGKLDGVPVCEECKRIEEGLNHFTRSFV